ncbi:MAG TPA: KTSC domain-containing protein [Balneolaceae bacterium]
MKRKKVSSEAISSIGYNSKGMILEIEFSSGSLYQYFSVPELEVENLLNAESIGRHFQENIKQGPYRYIRLN